MDITTLFNDHWLGRGGWLHWVLATCSCLHPYRNQAVEPYKVYMDCMAVEDILYNCYIAHCEMHPWDDIALYFGWMACHSTIIVPFLLECVIQKFNCCQMIPRHPFIFAPLRLTRQHIDEIFADYQQHMVLDVARETRAESDWSYADRYLTWFFIVSNPYMIHIATRSPPRPNHQEILQEQQSQMDHTQDVLSRCCQIVDTSRAGIGDDSFPEGFGVRHILDDIMEVAQGALIYCRHHVRTSGIVDNRGRWADRGGSGHRGQDTYVFRHT